MLRGYCESASPTSDGQKHGDDALAYEEIAEEYPDITLSMVRLSSRNMARTQIATSFRVSRLCAFLFRLFQPSDSLY
jgi:hypothetical protein